MSIRATAGLFEPLLRYYCLCMVVFSMQENIEQRYATETFASLTEAYKDVTLSITMGFKWQNTFKVGRENVEGDPRYERAISSTNEQNVEEVGAVKAKPTD